MVILQLLRLNTTWEIDRLNYDVDFLFLKFLFPCPLPNRTRPRNRQRTHLSGAFRTRGQDARDQETRSQQIPFYVLLWEHHKTKSTIIHISRVQESDPSAEYWRRSGNVAAVATCREQGIAMMVLLISLCLRGMGNVKHMIFIYTCVGWWEGGWWSLVQYCLDILELYLFEVCDTICKFTALNVVYKVVANEVLLR